MKMLTTNAVAMLIACGLATPVLAANTTPTNNQSPTTANQNQTETPAMTSVRQQVASDLGKAGYTDIHVMPESFLVRAKDSKGNPVMMVINPDSVTEVTKINAPKNTSTANNAANANNSGSKVMSGANANGNPTPPAKQ